MIWSEVGSDKYHSCEVCDKAPAFAVHSSECVIELGPWCREHWVELIDSKFDKLQDELDNEDWGGMPE